MTEITPEARIPQRRRRKIPMLLLVAFALGGGALYWYFTFQNERLGPVYAQLGIEPLPVLVSWQPSVQTELDRLRREPCYRDAVVKLANDLLDAGYPREAGAGLSSFASRCGVPAKSCRLPTRHFSESGISRAPWRWQNNSWTLRRRAGRFDIGALMRTIRSAILRTR
jgi:hypothetical protein